MNALDTPDVFHAGVLPSYAASPRAPALPSAPPPRQVVPAAVVSAGLPSCQPWGVHGGTHGVVERDAGGLCVTINSGRPGNRVAIDVALDEHTAIELAMRLVAQVDALRRAAGRGGLL